MRSPLSNRKNSDHHPFTTQMEGQVYAASDYRYGFNGMERDDELKGEGSSYDFGARMYDPRVGRWWSVDPLAIKYPNTSPFVFVLNCPVKFIDPNGMDVELWEGGIKVATISTQNGITIEKGFEHSPIIHNYFEARAYFDPVTDIFRELECDSRTLIIKGFSDPGGQYSTDYDAKKAPRFEPAEMIRFVDLDNNGKLEGDKELLSIKEPQELGTIKWYYNQIFIDGDVNYHSPAMVLLHELLHASHHMKDIGQFYLGASNKLPDVTNEEEQLTIKEVNELSGTCGNGDGGNGRDRIRTSHNKGKVEPWGKGVTNFPGKEAEEGDKK